MTETAPASHRFQMVGSRASMLEGPIPDIIEQQIQALEDAIERVPDFAFDLAKTLVETICKTIIEDSSPAFFATFGDAPSYFRARSVRGLSARSRRWGRNQGRAEFRIVRITPRRSGGWPRARCLNTRARPRTSREVQRRRRRSGRTELARWMPRTLAIDLSPEQCTETDRASGHQEIDVAPQTALISLVNHAGREPLRNVIHGSISSIT